MKINRLSLLTSILLLVTFSQVLLAQEIEVLSLEGGNCWIEPMANNSNGEIKLVSFSENSSYRFHKGHIAKFQEELEQELRKLGFEGLEEETYELYLKCNYQGATLRVGFYNTEPQICIHLRPKKEKYYTKIEINNIYPNHEEKRGFCSGQMPGKLLVNLTRRKDLSDESIIACIEDLQSSYQNLFTIKENNHISRLFHVTLSKEHHFREKEIKYLMINEGSCQEVILEKSVEYENLYFNVGTTYKILESYFPGF